MDYVVFGGGVYLQVTEVPRMMLVSFLLRSMYAWLPIHRHCYCGNDQSFDSRPRQRPVSDPYTCQHKERPKPAPYHDLPTIEPIPDFYHDLQVLQHNVANVSRNLIVYCPAASYVLFCCCAASCCLHRKGYGLEGSARLYWRLYDHALSKHQQMQVGTGAAIEQRIPIEPALDISVLVVNNSKRQLEQEQEHQCGVSGSSTPRKQFALRVGSLLPGLHRRD